MQSILRLSFFWATLDNLFYSPVPSIVFPWLATPPTSSQHRIYTPKLSIIYRIDEERWNFHLICRFVWCRPIWHCTWRDRVQGFSGKLGSCVFWLFQQLHAIFGLTHPYSFGRCFIFNALRVISSEDRSWSHRQSCAFCNQSSNFYAPSASSKMRSCWPLS